MRNNIFAVLIGFLQLTNWCHAQASHFENLENNKLPGHFRQAIASNNKILMVHLNDFYADADSIMAACHTLTSIQQLRQQNPSLDIMLAFGSSDEFNVDTLRHFNGLIQAKIAQLVESKGQSFADQHDDNLRLHYQQHVEHFARHAPPHLPFRIRDAAITLFPIADHLRISIELFAGDIRTQQKNLYPVTQTINVVENSNPYFGNFGVHYDKYDQDYIDRISTTKTLIDIIQSGQQQQRDIFVHSGGSLTLLSELAAHRDLAKHVHVLVMAFKQPIPGLAGFNQYPSHNESLNMAATRYFLEQADKFKSVEIIDSNTGYYAPVCVNDLTSFTDYTRSMALNDILSPGAYQNLIETEARHYNRYGAASSSYMKFTDSLLMAYQIGAVHIPMKTQYWQRLNDKESHNQDNTDNQSSNTFDYSLVPSSSGYKLGLPFLSQSTVEDQENYNTHPFSNNTQLSNQQPQHDLASQLKKDMGVFIKQQAEILGQQQTQTPYKNYFNQ